MIIFTEIALIKTPRFFLFLVHDATIFVYII